MTASLVAETKTDTYRLATRLAQRLAGRRYARCEPLAAILKALGCALTYQNPFGQSKTRRNVISSLTDLSHSPHWEIQLRDLTGCDNPLGQPTGLLADTLWVSYRNQKGARRS